MPLFALTHTASTATEISTPARDLTRARCGLLRGGAWGADRRRAVGLVAAWACTALGALSGTGASAQTPQSCAAKSPAQRTPVIELYTSEGCSSCPPADAWVSTLKNAPAVVQAFHVSYWDYIGWVDRFAAPQYTTRQRQLGDANRLRSIYTPQVVRNGQDFRDWGRALGAAEPAQASIVITQTAPEQFEAQIAPSNPAAAWSAYWSVTEHGHSSRVNAGENKGEHLLHDFVVRQYTAVGSYQGGAKLRFSALRADPKHPRQVNLVVFDAATHKPLQAISLRC